ncbi:hypothetical protein NDI45_20545 [Leptolyngbya sp. GB1-A1]|uniref:hypothetical protein n=1 Tax=Leptolyngbya sp. GB1-A1 TaxID=2933908 RepID=UPI00329A26B7
MGSVEIGVEGTGERRVPSWMGEAVLYGKYWSDRGLVDRLRSQVKVNRGRMGQYEVMDFVLLLNSYAVSGEASLKEYFKAIVPVSGLVMGLWERDGCPVASSLSRFLRDVDERAVESLRGLFEEEMGQKSIRVREGMWMTDRMGNRYLMFDVDGTVKAVRQRYVSESDRYPAARRRSAGVSEPGYRGRKRGEAVRTRTTVAVAHTSEWLGSYGSAGNGDIAGDLGRSLDRMQGYLESQGLRVSHGIVRLDGLYGSPKLVSQVQQNGIGYLMRSRDYALLKHPIVVARMQESEGWEAVAGREFEQRKDTLVHRRRRTGVQQSISINCDSDSRSATQWADRETIQRASVRAVYHVAIGIELAERGRAEPVFWTRWV